MSRMLSASSEKAAYNVWRSSDLFIREPCTCTTKEKASSRWTSLNTVALSSSDNKRPTVSSHRWGESWGGAPDSPVRIYGPASDGVWDPSAVDLLFASEASVVEATFFAPYATCSLSVFYILLSVPDPVLFKYVCMYYCMHICM